MRKLFSIAALLLLAAPGFALEVTAVSTTPVKGAALADFTFGPLTVKNIAWEGGAVVLPVTDNKGRKYTDVKLLSKSLYGKIEACFKDGFAKPAKAPAQPKVKVDSFRVHKSKARVASAEISFDGELLAVAGVMASRKEEGAFWVAFPPDLDFPDRAFKSAVESAVIAAWVKKGK